MISCLEIFIQNQLLSILLSVVSFGNLHSFVLFVRCDLLLLSKRIKELKSKETD